MATCPVGAGLLLYTQEGCVLTGYTPKIGKWSGFGGKIEAGESPWEAAVRETFEEVFGCGPTAEAIAALGPAPIPLQGDDLSASYLTYMYPLSRFLAVKPAASPYYVTVPDSYDGICEDRILVDDESQEISEIRFIAADAADAAVAGAAFEVADEFLDDLRLFISESTHRVE
jgi:8-oxo-dGTP pyrophosphatase MutT (NUDIX family)